MDDLRDIISHYRSRAAEVFSLLSVLILTVPIAVLLALVVGSLLSNAGIGSIVFFVALAVLIVSFKNKS